MVAQELLQTLSDVGAEFLRGADANRERFATNERSEGSGRSPELETTASSVRAFGQRGGSPRRTVCAQGAVANLSAHHFHLVLSFLCQGSDHFVLLVISLLSSK